MIGKIATGEVADVVTEDGKNKAAQAFGHLGGKARARAMGLNGGKPLPEGCKNPVGRILQNS